MKNQEDAFDKGITDGVNIVRYSVNDNGEYKMVSGPGGQPMNVANHLAWEEIDKHIQRAREKVACKRMSCLYYYMVSNHMDVSLLAKYTRQSRLRVRLHLIPFIFNRLGPRSIATYAELFQVSVEDLMQGRILPPVYRRNREQPRDD